MPTSMPIPMPIPMPSPGPQPLALMANPAAPHFAGGANVWQRIGNGTIKLFDGINKNYLYQFFALDVVSLWITRIITGLAVGRIAVNALNQPNPAANADTPFQLWRQNVAANVQGLNWGNAWEILKREGLQGPGSLLLPTLAYGATRWFTRNHTQDMNFEWFQKLHLAFQAGASSSGALTDTPTSHRLITNAVSQFFTPMAANDALATLRSMPLVEATMLRQMPRSHISLDLPDTRTLGSVLKTYDLNNTTVKTVGEFLDHWSHHYATQVQSIIKDHGGDRSKARKALAELAQSMGNDLEAVCRGVSRHQGVSVVNEGLMPLRELRSVTPLFQSQPSIAIKAMIKENGVSIQEFCKNLGHFSDYWLDVLPKPSVKTSVLELLGKAAAYTNKITRVKGLITVLGMIVGASWAYFLPKLTQSSKSYPAARLFKQAGSPVPTGAPQPVVTPIPPRFENNSLRDPVSSLAPRFALYANPGRLTV